MAHAAALLIGLAIGWVLLTMQAGAPLDWVAALVAAALCVALSWRFNIVRKGGGVLEGVIVFGLFARRIGAALRGAFSTARAAWAADVRLHPALVRVRLRAGDARERAALANLVSAAPGVCAVDLDEEGLLAHALREDRVDAHELGALEQRVSRALGEAAATRSGAS